MSLNATGVCPIESLISKVVPAKVRKAKKEFLNPSREDGVIEVILNSSIVDNIMTEVRGEENGNSDDDGAENNSDLPSPREQRKCLAVAQVIASTLFSDYREILKVISRVQNEFWMLQKSSRIRTHIQSYF